MDLVKSTGTMDLVKSTDVSFLVKGNGFVPLGLVESCREKLTFIKEKKTEHRKNLNCQLTTGFNMTQLYTSLDTTSLDIPSLEILIEIFDKIEKSNISKNSSQKKNIVENSNMNQFSLLEFDETDSDETDSDEEM